jgi:hypothetical protein
MTTDTPFADQVERELKALTELWQKMVPILRRIAEAIE